MFQKEMFSVPSSMSSPLAAEWPRGQFLSVNTLITPTTPSPVAQCPASVAVTLFSLSSWPRAGLWAQAGSWGPAQDRLGLCPASPAGKAAVYKTRFIWGRQALLLVRQKQARAEAGEHRGSGGRGTVQPITSGYLGS